MSVLREVMVMAMPTRGRMMKIDAMVLVSGFVTKPKERCTVYTTREAGVVGDLHLVLLGLPRGGVGRAFSLPDTDARGQVALS